MTLPTQQPVPLNPPLSSRLTLPTMYDLPSEDPEEPGLPDLFHLDQPQLLELTFIPGTYDPSLVFTASDLNLYYDLNHPNWYKRPDWFGAVGVPRLYEGRDLRLSYVQWQEPASPYIVVELLSPGTEEEDLGRTSQKPGKPPTKWQVYEEILRIPYYVVFSRSTNELQAFQLHGGRYEAATLQSGRLIIPELELSLGLWQGSYKNLERLWLRWFKDSGELILIPSERVVELEQRAIVAEQRAIASEQRAKFLEARLRELGIDPNQI